MKEWERDKKGERDQEQESEQSKTESKKRERKSFSDKQNNFIDNIKSNVTIFKVREIYTYISISVDIDIYLYMCIYIFINIFVYIYFYICIYVNHLVILWFELRDLHLLDRHSNTPIMSQAFFTLVIFQIVSIFYDKASLDLDTPIYTSHITGMKDMKHHAHLL
jgi:hypothetical protein